jgi:GNAT superfamily N-acetyltransferase
MEVLMFTLRAATAADAEALATLWHSGWYDGHAGHVPAALYDHRHLDDFRVRVPARLSTTTVAVDGPAVLGFLTVHDDELEQVYVAAPARGGGVAAALLRRGEEMIGARYDRAWLAVAAGNARARRFYAREGWRDAGALDYAAEIRTGRLPVACRRYEKDLRPAPDRGPKAVSRGAATISG